MTQTPGDEWFAPDGPDSERPPAEDDWLVERERRARAARLDLSALTGAQLSLIGAGVVAVVALVAVVLAFGDSTPSSGRLVPIAAGPAHVPARSQTTTPAPPARSVAAPTTTLKPGDSGAQVKTLQRELKSLGYTVGAVDGSYGTQTSKAVEDFQRAKHLTADGIVGPQTLQALAP